MTYPRSLDEYGDDELKAELERRAKLKKDGRCTYCERSTTSSACRFPERHSKKGRSKPPVLVIGDTSYELTQAFCEGALSYHYDVPYNTGNPYDDDDDRHEEWSNGHEIASEHDEKFTEAKARKALAAAKKRRL